MCAPARTIHHLIFYTYSWCIISVLASSKFTWFAWGEMMILRLNEKMFNPGLLVHHNWYTRGLVCKWQAWRKHFLGWCWTLCLGLSLQGRNNVAMYYIGQTWYTARLISAIVHFTALKLRFIPDNFVSIILSCWC